MGKAEVSGAGLNHRESEQHGSKTVSETTDSSFVSVRPLRRHSGVLLQHSSSPVWCRANYNVYLASIGREELIAAVVAVK